MADVEVLIVGAGPTGLVLAHWLQRLGVSFRLIDRAAHAGVESRALAVHARTLELYRQLGFADEVVEAGIPVDGFRVRRGDQTAAVEIASAGEGLTAYPFILVFAQDDHERLLEAKLEAIGVEVERSTELVELREEEASVVATLRKGDRIEHVRAQYVCGCDGAHSIVRRQTGAGFPGGTYQSLFFVADVKAKGAAADLELNLCLDRDRLCLVLPVRRSGSWRLIGLIPEALREQPELTFEAVRAEVEAVTRLKVEEVNWFSLYRVHHRVADRFREGRAFLLGDAAHIHSPVGGQGMNTGIGDASNLAWKLSEVLKGRAGDKLLDTYETERRAFALKLVATTDAVFQAAADPGPAGRRFRTEVIPRVLPVAFKAMKGLVFRTISQINLAYHSSPLAAGGAGKVRGGDRLPWLIRNGVDDYEALTALDWSIQVFGRARPPLRALADDLGIALVEQRWDRAAGKAGFMKDAIYLVRPDGYVAFAEPRQDPGALVHFVRRNGLFRGAKAVLEAPARREAEELAPWS